ncbi:hypothetical protein CDD81_4776 [Ophiocordyceps australis]|uniref:Copper transport protein n=1 Tax=Ophiocordyceps australis TaxID=1399860 RepID=A0A2C5YAK4_9HYPO|nr:hypothetical protein CDD81_4776 [Ophiocordyceps australis]
MDHSGMDHSGMDMGDGSACKISMLWNWYTIDACFLSSSWHITNRGMFAATCIGVVFLVVAVELLRRLGKEYDAFLLRQFQRRAQLHYSANHHHHRLSPSSAAADDADSGSSANARLGPQIVTFRATLLQQLTRAVIHAATFGGAYIVMLLAMYFNGYVIICIFIGAGLGKFLCDWLVVRLDVSRGPVDGSAPPKGIEEPSVCCG